MALYDDDPPCHNNYANCGFIKTELMAENYTAYEVLKINRCQLIKKSIEDENGRISERTVDVKTSCLWDTINAFNVEDKKAMFIKVLNSFRSLIREEVI